jgi:hypothetical protein
MSKALKGALLSGLVFPGLGEFVLKSYGRGVAFVVLTLACLGTLVGTAVQRAEVALEVVQAAGEAVDLDTISKAASDAVTHGGGGLALAALLLLALCWVASIVDAYWIGRKADAGRRLHPSGASEDGF